MEKKITALLIDDDNVALSLLKNLLEETDVFSRIITTTQSQMAISICEEEKPDVLFLDIEMPHIDGFELLEKIRGYVQEVVFVTAYSEYALKAIRASCLHYILKPPDREKIKSIIERLKEKSFIDNNLRKLYNGKLAFYRKYYNLFNTLTEREKLTLKLTVLGLTNKEIGRDLNISPFTVKTHRQNIYRKLDTTNILDLIQFVEVFLV